MPKPQRAYQDIDIRTSFGQFFYVEFVKKDDTLRQMTCRRFVEWDGGKTDRERSWEPEDYNLLQVWDVDKEDYRFINLETIKLLRAGGDEIRYDI